jgi:hypothetical protein
MDMNHWILASLDLTNKYMLRILYNSKTPHEEVFCENTQLYINKLMNVDNLNYIYANVIKQLDYSSCGLALM